LGISQSSGMPLMIIASHYFHIALLTFGELLRINFQKYVIIIRVDNYYSRLCG